MGYHYNYLSIKNEINICPFPEDKVFGKWMYIKHRIRIKLQLWSKIKCLNYNTLDYEANCAICKQPMTYKECNIDHIIPVSKGGKHIITNLQLTHIKCNSIKGNYCEIEQSGSSPVS